MIELLYESDGLAPFQVTPKSVSGLQVFYNGMFVQILEGPENEVWALVEQLGGTQRNVMKTEISSRSLSRWNARLVTAETLPVRLTQKLIRFAEFIRASDTPETEFEGRRAASAVNALSQVSTVPHASLTIGAGPQGACLAGRDGNRAWVAV